VLLDCWRQVRKIVVGFGLLQEK